jgi:hypothetical protein
MALALPDDWRWDSAIKDFASLKENVERFKARSSDGWQTVYALTIAASRAIDG